MTSKLVIFSDMDGTFLDHNTYSYAKTKPAIERIKRLHIPLVFCSSRVRPEIEEYTRRIDVLHPFISENGGAIFVPHRYFHFRMNQGYPIDGYDVMEFGTAYSRLRAVLCSIREKTGYAIQGFGDMTISQLSRNAGISANKAKIAKKRDYSEPFLFADETKSRLMRVRRLIKSYGLHYTKGGRYHYIMGSNDKGRAVQALTKLYIKESGPVETIGIGDGMNDLPMLLHVDRGYQVRNHLGEYSFKHKKIEKVDGIGPGGFTEAVLRNL